LDCIIRISLKELWFGYPCCFPYLPKGEVFGETLLDMLSRAGLPYAALKASC